MLILILLVHNLGLRIIPGLGQELLLLTSPGSFSWALDLGDKNSLL